MLCFCKHFCPKLPICRKKFPIVRAAWEFEFLISSAGKSVGFEECCSSSESIEYFATFRGNALLFCPEFSRCQFRKLGSFNFFSRNRILLRSFNFTPNLTGFVEKMFSDFSSSSVWEFLTNFLFCQSAIPFFQESYLPIEVTGKFETFTN